MVQINFALKEVNCKVVYYGPGLSGKTTNLEVVHAKAPSTHVGELTSIATEGDRTLFFDFLPLNLGQVAGMNTKFQIYTVPGQVYYNSTRKLVLQGADGIVFVADSRRGKMDENLESLANLEENLREYGMDIRTMPFVIQYNKRDLPDVYPVEELQEKLNRFNAPTFEAVAVNGEGVFPTLKKLSSMVLESLNRQQGSTCVRKPPREQAEPVAVAASAGRARAAAAPTPPAAAAKPAQPAAKPAVTPRTPPARHAAKPAPVEEMVTDSPGVKPIQRRTPAVPPASSQAHAPSHSPTPAPAGPAVVRKKPHASIPQARDSKRRNRFPVALVVVIVVAALGAGAVYLSGIWRSLVP